MNIRVNGQDQTFEKATITVAEMLTLSSVSQLEMVSVQLNGTFVSKEDYANALIRDGDEIDFLYFMGGGIRRWSKENNK